MTTGRAFEGKNVVGTAAEAHMAAAFATLALLACGGPPVDLPELEAQSQALRAAGAEVRCDHDEDDDHDHDYDDDCDERCGARRLFGDRGAVPAPLWRLRQREYLRHATRVFEPRSVLNVVAHLERARVDRAHRLGPGSVPIDAWDAQLARMAGLRDLRDFDALDLLHVLFEHRTHPALAPGLAGKTEQALLGFKFWFTEPTAPGLRDDSYYWSENHALTYHTVELLMGERYPDAVFTNDGRHGAAHREHARPRLLRWLELRARYGFSEWHSNVYYQKDAIALLALVELGLDEEIRTRAAAVLDLLLFDLALHTHDGAFGVTHGRSYKQDITSARHENTWHLAQLLFARGDASYHRHDDAGAVLMARARRYRMPEAIRQVGQSEVAFVDRERMGIAIDDAGPPRPGMPAPSGLSFEDPEEITTWWGMGAFASWQVVPLTLQVMERHQIWDNPFFAPFRGLRPLGANPRFAQAFAAQASALLGSHLLAQVNTYTFRSRDVMLSSAVDYRPGTASVQGHAWQATLDPDAVVFTTHPFTPPIASTKWSDDGQSGGYFTGQASFPRSAQHENVAIHIYNPLYPSRNAPPLDAFRYEPYTHAYFPQDHFDEVVQEGGWTFGRKRGGYVALHSHRPAAFRTHDASVATGGMKRPFDLVAAGGADNVWIVEVGRARDFRSFAAFRAAILKAPLVVTARPAPRPGLTGGYDVVYRSPSRGELRFGWTGAFLADGHEVATRDFPRYDNPWASVPFGAERVEISSGRHGVALDFAAGTRVTTAHAGRPW